MSAKRLTPQNEGRASRVAQNLNKTTTFGRQFSLPRFQSGSASKLPKTQSSSDLSVAGGSECPTIKSAPNTGVPAVDDELECLLVYNEYLQALMKKEIASNTIKKRQQDLKDQLAIQNDDLEKSKTVFRKKEQELWDLKNLKETRDLLKVLEENIDTFARLKVDTDLEDILKQLLVLLDTYSKRMHVKNVKLIVDQEGIDKLQILLEKLEALMQKIKFSEQHVEAVTELAGLLQKFQEVSISVEEKQSVMQDLYKNVTHKVLKAISDMYTEKEQYEKAVC